MENVQFEEEKDTGVIDVTAEACAAREAVLAEEIGAIREKPDLHWNKGK